VSADGSINDLALKARTLMAERSGERTASARGQTVDAE
jgi:hypothetical protein